MIIYEQPLNEKIRLFLRLELLVRRFRHHLKSENCADTLAALSILLELYNLTARIDLKSEVIKETDRMSQAVRRVINGVSSQDQTLSQLTDHCNVLYQLRGHLGQHLRTHVLFSALRQRAALPGGVNGFDIPLVNYWLEKDSASQVANLREWGEPFMQTADAASFLLDLIRTSCDGNEHQAKEGFFQMSLGMGINYQLLQIILPDGSPLYPEISAGKQRFSLRFVEADMLSERGKQVRDTVSFNLKLCAF